MGDVTSLHILLILEGSQGTIMSNFMPINLRLQIKWTNSLKDKIPKFTQEQTDNLNRQLATKHMEIVQKNAPTKNTAGLDGFTGKFSQNV